MYVLAKCNERSLLVFSIVPAKWGRVLVIAVENSKIHMVQSTVTEREAREGILRDIAGEWNERRPLVYTYKCIYVCMQLKFDWMVGPLHGPIMLRYTGVGFRFSEVEISESSFL